jgi:hypothetical protein
MRVGTIFGTVVAGVASLAVLGTTGGAAIGTSAPARASATSSRPLPKVQTAGMSGSWHGGTWRVRPRTVAFGALYEVRRIKWSSWTGGNAFGRGHLVACASEVRPTGCHNGVVNIHLYGVFNHAGPGRNFGNLKYSGSHSKHLWINSQGSWTWNR